MPKRSRLRIIETPTYVGIERAIILGPDPKKSVDGQIYITQSDGCLRPIDGKELTALFAKYPDFIKRWRLDS